MTRRTLYPSASVAYTVDRNGTTGFTDDPCAGSRIVEGSLEIGRVAVQPENTYRITVNNFLADGGDRFTILPDGTNRIISGLDIDALTAYLPDSTAVAAPPTDRIAVAG